MTPELITSLQREIEKSYPNLHVHPLSEGALIRGSFPIVHDGKVLDRYAIEVRVWEDFPQSVPVVREIGGRIPAGKAFHNSNGEACLFVREERWQIWPPGSTLLDFLNGPVRNYFMGQAIVERGGDWPFGERAHCDEGVFEYYEELLGTREPRTILGILKLLSVGFLEEDAECPCGSELALAHCHLLILMRLRQGIPPWAAKELLQMSGPILLRWMKARNWIPSSEADDSSYTGNRKTHPSDSTLQWPC